MKINVISESAFTVQGHGVHSAYTDTVQALRQYTDAKVLENARGKSDVVHLHTVGPYSLARLMFSSGAKVVSAHVTPDSFEGSLVGAKYWRSLALFYLRWFYNRADIVIAVSHDVELELAKMGVTRRIELIPNMIDVSKFQTSRDERNRLRDELAIPADAFVVVGNGQVQPRKRIDTFVDTAKRLPSAYFVWVGGMPFGSLAARSREMTGLMDKHPKNVRFTGLVERMVGAKYLRAGDVFFFPSMQETFGLSVLEAAAAGLPLVLRDLEVYRLQFAGGYISATDDSFAEDLHKLKSNSAYYSEWSHKAIKLAGRYDAKTVVRKLVQVYEQAQAIQRQRSHKR